MSYLTQTLASELFCFIWSKLSMFRLFEIIWAPSSEFVSSSIPSWQISTAHAQPFRGARDLVFCLKVPLDSLLVWASSGGSGETAWMRSLAWTFAARIGDKYQIRLAWSICKILLDGNILRKGYASTRNKFEHLYMLHIDQVWPKNKYCCVIMMTHCLFVFFFI